MILRHSLPLQIQQLHNPTAQQLRLLLNQVGSLVKVMGHRIR